MTTQEIVAVRDGDRVRLSVRRVGAPAVDVALDAEEVEALRTWLDR